MNGFIHDKLFTKYYILDKIFSDELFNIYEIKDSSDTKYILKLFIKGKYDSKLFNEIEKGMYINSHKEVNSFFVKYITSKSEIKSKRTLIIYEFSETKTLEDLLMKKFCFDERLSLIIFWKIAELVDSLYKIGLTQTNLKLDNILIDENYNIKMTGYSSIQFIQGKNMFHNDIFKLAFLLLQLLTGKCYLKKQESKILKIIKQGNFAFFWESIEIQNNQKFSQKLKDYITKMLEPEKNNLNLDDILHSKNGWFNGIESNNNDMYMKTIFKQFEEESENF